MQTMQSAVTSARNKQRSCCVSIVHAYFSALAIPVGTRETRKYDALPVMWQTNVCKHEWYSLKTETVYNFCIRCSPKVCTYMCENSLSYLE